MMLCDGQRPSCKLRFFCGRSFNSFLSTGAGSLRSKVNQSCISSVLYSHKRSDGFPNFPILKTYSTTVRMRVITHTHARTPSLPVVQQKLQGHMMQPEITVV